MSLFNKKSKKRDSMLPPVYADSEWAKLFGINAQEEPLLALQVTAVFRCVDIISKTMASLPLNLYVKEDGGARKYEEHPLHNLLYILPNENTTRYEFIQMGIANLLLTRGMYVKIKHNARGQVTALYNIPTKNVIDNRSSEDIDTITVNDYRLGISETLGRGDFLYIPSFLYSDSIRSEDPMYIAAKALGLVNTADTYSKMAMSGANPGGFVTYPGQMSDESYERFKKTFNENYTGAQNAGKWLFLEEGAQAKEFERDMAKNQVLELRKWTISEICRIFGVPPHMAMDMEHATFSNIEQQSMEYVRDCIEPMCVRLEQAFYRDFLSAYMKKDCYFKFNLNSLLRGDTATRSQYYHNARQDGWMSANDIRSLEDMNGIGEQGDIYCVNGNLIPLSEVPNNKPKGSRTNNGQ